MPIHVVTYEDVAFTSGGRDPDTLFISDPQVEAFNEALSARGDVPAWFKGLVGGSVSVDDSVYKDGKDPSGDVKLFVSVRARVEADDADAAEALAVPDDLMGGMSTLVGGDLDHEGDWQAIDSEEEAPGPRP